MPHYQEHLDAIHKHLPDGLRGQSTDDKWALLRQLDSDDVVMVAGYDDIFEIPNQWIIYVEHGAGQRYLGVSEKAANYYHGGTHPRRVIGYIAPREEVAYDWARPAFAAGSPVCDPYELYGEEGVVAITFHWDAHQVCTEATSAFNHYAQDMPRIIEELRLAGYEVLGHRHPRFAHLSTAWKNWGVPEVDVDTVRRRASVLIADNTSLMYEMGYLWRNVVALNAPWYRRDVEHGLRFWSCLPSTVCDGPSSLLQVIADGGLERATFDAAGQAYGGGVSDGGDGVRAATWVTARVHDL